MVSLKDPTFEIDRFTIHAKTLIRASRTKEILSSGPCFQGSADSFAKSDEKIKLGLVLIRLPLPDILKINPRRGYWLRA